MRHKDQCLGGCFFSKSVYSDFTSHIAQSMFSWCFLRKEIRRGFEWPSSRCKREIVVLVVSLSCSVAKFKASCSIVRHWTPHQGLILRGFHTHVSCNNWSWRDAMCTDGCLSPAFDEGGHEDIVWNTTNLTRSLRTDVKCQDFDAKFPSARAFHWHPGALPPWNCSFNSENKHTATTKTRRPPYLLQNCLAPVLLSKPEKHVYNIHMYTTEFWSWLTSVCAVWYREVSATQFAVFSQKDLVTISWIPFCGDVHSIPVTVSHSTSTMRGQCATQQIVRRATDVSTIDPTLTSRMYPRVDHSIIETHSWRNDGFEHIIRNHTWTIRIFRLCFLQDWLILWSQVSGLVKKVKRMCGTTISVVDSAWPVNNEEAMCECHEEKASFGIRSSVSCTPDSRRDQFCLQSWCVPYIHSSHNGLLDDVVRKVFALLSKRVQVWKSSGILHISNSSSFVDVCSWSCFGRNVYGSSASVLFCCAICCWSQRRVEARARIVAGCCLLSYLRCIISRARCPVGRIAQGR